MDVSFVIVTWNVREMVRRALASILGDASGLETEIIVVDNASVDKTAEMVRAEFPGVQLLINDGNLGFTRANNQAMALANGRFFFLLNPDTELIPGATGALLDYAEAHPQVGIVGPELLNSDLTPQSSRRRFPTLGTGLLESTRLQQFFPRNQWLARYYVQDKAADMVQDVDWVTGAALFVRRGVYELVGGLDESFFMYSEELDWCFRAHRQGWRVVYFPQARVIHHEAKSSEQALAARDIYFHSSKVRFFRKYHGLAQATILRLFLLTMFIYQMMEEVIKWLLGHKRVLRAARVKAYWEVLKSGLG